ncbi:MAG: alpha-amylase [Pirellulaceae bacterium]|nr:MAG: alpha-amylase [Pirellulaceae bacterium]
MTSSIRFCLVLHNHQPVGNFDGVIRQAFEDSYLPFLEIFESYSDLALSLHISGPLMEWLAQHQPGYLDRLRRLVASGRVEILGGPFYEPILTMIPPRDRIGQITRYRTYLEQNLGATVQGIWVPERVWEQELTRDLADAGVRYTILDDFHFKNAGLVEEQLIGYYLTEDDGRLLAVFPGSERLRYLIPFAAPEETVRFLRSIADRHPQAVVVFGDDGEKFGTWPQTKKHVYQDGWLRRFFDMLVAERHWLKTTTLFEAYQQLPAAGKIYLPDASYREMTEWALPVERQVEYEDLVQELQQDPRWPRLRHFLRGGYWRNFKVKYPEANEMYSRMMYVSRRLESARQSGIAAYLFEAAQQALYRSQCNCGYWHGAFGGIYLPHLRNAVYRELITADNYLDQATGRAAPFVEAAAEDYDFDQRTEVRLANDKLIVWLAPSRGGQMYELDVRSVRHNLLATLARRPEAYHRKVLAGASHAASSVASIHDRVVFKQEGLDKRVQYDRLPRKSLQDHFLARETSAQAFQQGCGELGDFLEGAYEARIRRDPDRIQVLMSRQGLVEGRTVRLTKAVTLHAGSNVLRVGYLLEQLPLGVQWRFAIEWNFAGLPAGADDRYFRDARGERLGHLGTWLDLNNVQELSLTDEWLGLSVHLHSSRPANFWTFPIETVSQSEAGFELVHQSVVVTPYWDLQPDAEGRWSVVLELALDSSLADQRLGAERSWLETASPELVALS